MANAFTVGHHKLPKASDLWYQKARAYFNSLDVDGNNFLSLRDKDKMTDRFIKKHHRIQHSQNEKRFKVAMDEMWNFLEAKPKETYDSYLEKRLEMLDFHNKEESHSKLTRSSFYEIIFEVMDLNHDSKLDFEEASMFLEFMKRNEDRDEAEMRDLYKKMDLDKDGMINKNEFYTAFYEFEFCQEPSDFDTLCGPLPSLKDSKPKKPMFK